MSASAKIDFEPGLFDEGHPEAAPDLPTIQPKRRANRAPFIVAGCLLLVLTAAFLVVFNTTSKPKAVPAMLIEGPQKAVSAFSLPTAIPRAKVDRHSVSEGFCAGFEALCFIGMTDKPAETLAKLAAALPQGDSKHYRVNVSVVPLNE